MPGRDTNPTNPDRDTLDVPELRLRRAQRILGWEMVAAAFFVVAFLPASPADQSSIGGWGWPVVALVAAAQLSAGLYLARTRSVVSRDVQLAMIWSLVIAIAVFVLVTGGEESPYNPMFILAAGAVGGQSPRRTAGLAAGVMLLACSPLLYSAFTANDAVRFVLTGMLTALFMAFIVWVAREIREQGIDQRVETQTAVDLAEELRRLDHAKDRFISAAAHELRSPLSVILMQSEELLAEEVGAITDDQRGLLEVTRRSAERLNRTVGELLELAQMDAGVFTLLRADFAVGESIARLCDDLEVAASARDISISRRLDEQIFIHADRERLELVFGNVLSNAIKYSREGGEVRVGTTRRGSDAVIEIADDGIGIPEDEVGRVGERFFRAATALGTKGTGLGLAIASEILELHAGRFEIASREGLGTTVIITLPVGEPSAAPAPASRAAGAPRRGAGVERAAD